MLTPLVVAGAAEVVPFAVTSLVSRFGPYIPYIYNIASKPETKEFVVDLMLGDGPGVSNPNIIALGRAKYLGDEEYLKKFAKFVGGQDYTSWGQDNFKVQFLKVIQDPKNTIHFNLDGIDDVWKEVSEGAKGFDKSRFVTSWELYTIYVNKESINPRIKFYRNNVEEENPFK
ncbi:MAG: hypothetical protein ACK5C0_07475 [Candidatus Kapaibacterium sp.]